LIVAPYGAWKSPISAELVVSRTVGIAGAQIDSGKLFWMEGRAEEKGRCVVVTVDDDGKSVDITPPPYYVRTQVHEYGGRAWTVHAGIVYFSNFPDGRLYRQSSGEAPIPLTKDEPIRYGDMVVDQHRNRLIAIREDHSNPEREATNEVVAVDLESGVVTVLVSGNDFYVSPRLSTDGFRLTWLTWNHPDMPWHGTELWLADLDSSGVPAQARRIAGSRKESIASPQFSPDGVLYFVSDINNWWNIHRLTDSGSVECVCSREMEFARPHWALGYTSFAFSSASEALVIYFSRGRAHLGRLDLRIGDLVEVETGFEDFDSVVSDPSGEHAFAVVGSSILAPRLARIHLSSGNCETVKLSSSVEVDERYLSRPEAIEFPTTHDRTAHAFYYPPRNADHQAPEGDLPPLLVKSHGGPTSSTTAVFRLGIQYWTSRGFGVLDVNYSGSAGFGRAYRDRLAGTWGLVDVEDCEAGAHYLVDRGLADPERLAITGGSAGGFTTLCALTFGNTFHAGASHFGVSDLEGLALETHKFESHYLDYLIGPYPEAKSTYKERSPINFVEKLSCPSIFFQGLEDRVVPSNQAELMVDALRAKGVPVAYVPFPEEHHGFRVEANIKRALEGEFYFYSRVFGYMPADPIEPVHIHNLDVPSDESRETAV